MAVKLAKAMGADVTVISTSERKKKMALEMGADHFVVSKDDKQMLVSIICSSCYRLAWDSENRLAQHACNIKSRLPMPVTEQSNLFVKD